MYCNGVIPIGEKYSRDTLVYEGTVYDWIAHEDCCTVANLLDMFSKVDEGLGDYDFNEFIYEYLAENYRDAETDDLPEHIDNMKRIDQVRMIISDWDKPFIKIPRLKRQLLEYKEWYSSRRLSLPDYAVKKIEAMEKELRELATVS